MRWCIVALGVLLVSGCAGFGSSSSVAQESASSVTPTVSVSPTRLPEPEPTPSYEPSPEPEPSPTEFQSFPPAPEGETEEQRAIREGWEEHQRVVDSYLKDPSKRDLLPLQATVTGVADQEVVDSVIRFIESGRKRTGNIAFRDVEVVEQSMNDDGEPTAVVTFCQDFTDQRLVDAETGDPVTENLLDTVRGRTNMVFDSRERWVVSERMPVKDESC